MIELQGIGRAFAVGDEQVQALRDIYLTIAAGEYLAVMGPSGSGKSTLLNIIGLLDQPDRGRYLLTGQDTTVLNETAKAELRGRTIGFIFQSFHLVPRLTACDNIELPMILAGLAPAERRQRMAQALTAFGLQDRARHRPAQLSGGQRQRVAIARATVMQPAILLADEPTGNLDRAAGRDIIEILEGLHQQGLTLIMVTHDPELGQRAGRLLTMQDGRIATDRSRLGQP